MQPQRIAHDGGGLRQGDQRAAVFGLGLRQFCQGLLCSDGLTNMISDEEIALVLREVPFFEAPSILVDRALQAGGQDNITVLLMGVEITEVNHG